MQDDENISRSPIRRSYVVAVVIFVLLAVWVASGEVNRVAQLTSLVTGSSAKDKAPATKDKVPASKAAEAKPAETKPGEQKTPEKTTVRVRTLTAQTRQQDVIVRGQTQALRKV